MTSPSVRRFTVTDGMVLIAATAVALGMARPLARFRLENHVFDGSPVGEIVCNTISLLGLCWASALLLLRLRRPRPGLRELAGRPGFSATVAVSLATAIHAVVFFADLVRRPKYSFDNIYWHYCNEFTREPAKNAMIVAPAVASVWLVQALGGRLEAEPTWIDRAGRSIGIFWLGSVLGFVVLTAWF